MLLTNGANIEAETEDGWHPIHSAARWNQADVIAILLENNCDINAKSKSGQTPLHLAAAEKDSKETLTLLLQNCDIDVNAQNSLGDTAEDIANRTSELCKLFQERRDRLAKSESGENSKSEKKDGNLLRSGCDKVGYTSKKQDNLCDIAESGEHNDSTDVSNKAVLDIGEDIDSSRGKEDDTVHTLSMDKVNDDSC